MTRPDPLDSHPRRGRPAPSVRPHAHRSVPLPPAIRRDEDHAALIDDYVASPRLLDVPEFEPIAPVPDVDEPDGPDTGPNPTSFRTDGGTVTTFPPTGPPRDVFWGESDLARWDPEPDGSITVDQALFGMDEPATDFREVGADRYDSDIELDALLAELSAVAETDSLSFPDGPGDPVDIDTVDDRAGLPPSNPPRRSVFESPAAMHPNPMTGVDDGTGSRSERRQVISPHMMNQPIIQAEDLTSDDAHDGRLWSMAISGLLMLAVLGVAVVVALVLA